MRFGWGLLLAVTAVAQIDRSSSGVGVFSDPGGGPSPERRWLPPEMAYPLKLSPDLYVNDEYPSVTRDRSGRVWIAWASCRPTFRHGGSPEPNPYNPALAGRLLDRAGWALGKGLRERHGRPFRFQALVLGWQT